MDAFYGTVYTYFKLMDTKDKDKVSEKNINKHPSFDDHIKRIHTHIY